jgi:hypothetical protein
MNPSPTIPGRVLAVALAAALAVTLPTIARAQRGEAESRRAPDFEWSEVLAPGKTIAIHNVNGGIHATYAAGTKVEVVARKIVHRGDPDLVRIEASTDADGVTICTLYPSSHGRCGSQHADRDDDRWSRGRGVDPEVSVEYEVRVPRGVRLEVHTVNGDVEATDLRGAVWAQTVNGGVEVSTSEDAEASTVNGSITATVGVARWEGRLEFRTVNGSIEVNLPRGAAARLEASSLNGDIESDLPVAVRGKVNRQRLSGTVGDGGEGSLVLSTVNGGIRLRERS